MGVAVRKLVLFVFSSILIISLSQFLVIQTEGSRTKTVILRIHSIAIYQILMSVFSYIAWSTLRPFPRFVISTPLPPTTLPIINKLSLKFKAKTSLKRQKSSEQDLSSQDDSYSKSDDENQKYWTLWDYAVALYIILCHGSYATNVFLVGADPHWFSLLCYACLGSLIQLGFAVVFIHCIVFIYSKLTSLFCGKKSRSTSRQHSRDDSTYQRNVTFLATIYVIIVSMIGFYVAAQPPNIKLVDIPIKDLPDNLRGLRIVQLSDIHLGPTVGYSKLKRVVDIAEKQNPDILVITGDLVDGTVEDLKDSVLPLKFINPRYGKYYVTGNHEYILWEVDKWFTLLRSLNFTILHNSNIKIHGAAPKKQGHICLAGTDDLQADKSKYGMGHTFDIKKAVDGCDDDHPVILLAHQPNAAQMALDTGTRLDLILSGHTHGGQFFPFIFLVHFISPYNYGLYKIEGRDSHLYVSPGTQYWGIPMRIGASMEVTCIKLI